MQLKHFLNASEPCRVWIGAYTVGLGDYVMPGIEPEPPPAHRARVQSIVHAL